MEAPAKNKARSLFSTLNSSGNSRDKEICIYNTVYQKNMSTIVVGTQMDLPLRSKAGKACHGEVGAGHFQV